MSPQSCSGPGTARLCRTIAPLFSVLRGRWEPGPGGAGSAGGDFEEAFGAEEGGAGDAGGAGGGEDLAGGARAGGEEIGEPVAGFGEGGEGLGREIEDAGGEAPVGTGGVVPFEAGRGDGGELRSGELRRGAGGGQLRSGAGGELRSGGGGGFRGGAGGRLGRRVRICAFVRVLVGGCGGAWRTRDDAEGEGRGEWAVRVLDLGEHAAVGGLGIGGEQEDRAGGGDDAEGAADAVEDAAGGGFGEVTDGEDGDARVARDGSEPREEAGLQVGAAVEAVVEEEVEGVENDEARMVVGADGLFELGDVRGQA